MPQLQCSFEYLQKKFVYDFGKYSRQVFTCTLRQWKTRNRKRLSLHLEESYKCPQKNVKPRKHISLSIAIASSGFSPPKPRKLCGNICKALRGNNGPYLTTDRRSLEKVGYARMADSSTHRQSHFLYMPMLLKPLCARTLKNQGQISLLVWGQKKISNMCRLLHSKTGAQLRHLELKLKI